MKYLSSIILSLVLLGIWSCSDYGVNCPDGLDCSGECGGSAIVDCAGTCNGNAVEDNNGYCTNISYSATIQPLFITDNLCTSCHNVSLFDHENISSLVSTGDSTSSTLIIRLKGQVTPQMPKDKDSFEGSIITLIATWIQEGAANN